MKTDLYEKMHPLVVVLVHRQEHGTPQVLFVKKSGDRWSLPHDFIRVKEQPYNAGLRVINDKLELSLGNVRLRCYFCNAIYGKSKQDHTLASYYTLKLRDEEVRILDSMLANSIKHMEFDEHLWLSVYEKKLDDSFDSKMSYCWETMRKAIASNYGVRLDPK